MAVYLIDTLKQKNNGNFGLIDVNDIIGGYYQVDSIEERNAIPTQRRKEGMLCWVKNPTNVANSKTYQLIGGIENTNWIEKVWSSSGGSVGGDNEVIIPNGYSLVWIGRTPPENKDMLWWDTNEDGILEDETENDMLTVNKLLTEMNELKTMVSTLKKRIEYLEQNGVVKPTDPSSNEFAILLEDGTPLLLEDGTPILLEH